MAVSRDDGHRPRYILIAGLGSLNLTGGELPFEAVRPGVLINYILDGEFVFYHATVALIGYKSRLVRFAPGLAMAVHDSFPANLYKTFDFQYSWSN
ncbi:hypothetical protein GCM10007416_03120 [Kroppenstedtia guangzhouensis]|jgi:hypothetical protein|uniref:Uncharacterized protein n=1 Tax=Kroppenstedtia guangzhouensis TaxID=1274356 RepID=A0ABQ1G1L1_9BACL|nr:hypothetical protein GCM10007416_03120 [Kroppenstedtia guangzhouensis]